MAERAHRHRGYHCLVHRIRARFGQMDACDIDGDLRQPDCVPMGRWGRKKARLEMVPLAGRLRV
jgi:hypothetical protein